MVTDEHDSRLLSRLRETRPARALVPLARRAINVCVEQYLKIDTDAHAPVDAPGGGHFADSNDYAALDYPLVAMSIAAMDLRPDDVVYEIGCGLGRVLCVMARQRVRKCVGVELSPALAAGARLNLSRVRGRRAAAVQVIAGDAAFVDYGEATAIYMFNPFGQTTMAAVLERIGASLQAAPRRIRIM
jgi:SAM-dependent methyltransferase